MCHFQGRKNLRSKIIFFFVSFTFLQIFGNLRKGPDVEALGAQAICDKIPGLTAKQKETCRNSPSAMVAAGDGIRLGKAECRHQFKHQRWNCTEINDSDVFGHVFVVGSREAAFVYAISSAGITYSVTAACGRGNISSCGCDQFHQARKDFVQRHWKWGGCSSDVRFGIQFARKFLDARESEGDARSLMNLHNNKAGRKAVKINLLMECKCHGVSGSCTMKTCWKILPPFRRIGDGLMKKYSKARPVVAVQSRKIFSRSPNYCEKDLNAGSLGTTGRYCHRTSKGTDGCDLLCCGRGYNTHQHTKSWQCRCKFHWCCYVNCDTCNQKLEEYTCK